MDGVSVVVENPMGHRPRTVFAALGVLFALLSLFILDSQGIAWRIAIPVCSAALVTGWVLFRLAVGAPHPSATSRTAIAGRWLDNNAAWIIPLTVPVLGICGLPLVRRTDPSSLLIPLVAACTGGFLLGAALSRRWRSRAPDAVERAQRQPDARKP
jgi:small neutral amino acid transporter SnatA (MarC family)